MKAIAYLRVSTAGQDLGPRAQVQAIREWARVNDVTICRWRFDRGVSGGAELADRLQLVCAMSDLRIHGAELLVVAKRDRISRDVTKLAFIEHDIERAGARIVAADSQNMEDPTGKLMRRVLDAFAEFELEMIRARTKAALAVKRAKRERLGAPAYGVRVEAAPASATGRRQPGQAMPVEAERQAIAYIIDLRSRGLSPYQIAARLAEEAVPTKRGGKWSAVQVRRLLRRHAA